MSEPQLCEITNCTNRAATYIEGQYTGQFLCAHHAPADAAVTR